MIDWAKSVHAKYSNWIIGRRRKQRASKATRREMKEYLADEYETARREMFDKFYEFMENEDSRSDRTD